MIKIHTAGPWKFNGTLLVQNSGNRLHIGEFVSAPGLGYSDDANKRLIEAAPALLEIVEGSVRFLADLNGSNWIAGDDVASKDMRQRALALHQMAFQVKSKASAQ